MYDTVIENFSPTSGGTISMSDSQGNSIAIINNTSKLATLTLNLPPFPHIGQVVTIIADSEITSLQPVGAAYPLDAVTIQKKGYVSYIYDQNNAIWMLSTLNPNKAVVNGVQYTGVFPYFASANVSAGVATFYLTDNGLSTGNAVFTDVFLQSINLIISDATNQYNFSGFTVASNKKSVTVNINKLGTVVLGIIQMISAANGVTAYLQISGR